MAQRALGKSGSSSSSEEVVDPIVEAQKTTRALLADEIIANQLAKGRADRLEAEARAAEAVSKREKAESGEGKGSEPAFKMTGEIGLGKFNMLEMLEQRVSERDTLRKEAQEQANTQAGINEDLRERLHTKELEVMQTGFDAQMESLKKLIESSASRGTFMDQYNMTKELAGAIGMVAPGVGTSDLTVTMELEKMKFEQNLELRKMSREEKRADREFQRQLKKDEDEREEKRQEAGRLAKRDDIFASAPEVLGRAIVKGYVEGQRVEGSQAANAPKKGGHIEAGWGEGGTADCPTCQQPIGVGPTARAAVCTNCGAESTIKRVGEKPPPEPVEEEE